MNERVRIWPVFGLTLLFVLSSACSGEQAGDLRMSGTSGPEYDQISYQEDMCEFTDRLIETVRYGGRLVMKSGEVYNFMSVECLAGFYLGLTNKSEVVSLRVTDFTHGKRLMDVEKMIFLNSNLRPSPNGMYLSAIEAADTKMVTNIYEAYPGPLLDWEEVLELVEKEWNLDGSAGTAELAF